MTRLYLHDVVTPQAPEGHDNVVLLSGDITSAEQTDQLAGLQADIVFHLASTYLARLKKKFDKGWSINMRGGWALLEALRAQHEQSGGSYRPKVIFASSIAVFGPPFPEAINDEFLCAPQTSYGAQKACIEMLVADYARKGLY